MENLSKADKLDKSSLIPISYTIQVKSALLLPLQPGDLQLIFESDK